METERKVNILLVDDEPRNIAALEVVLAAPDRELVTAASGEQALRRLLDTDFAVIPMDVRMPGLDGFETAALVRQRERSRDTPVIFLTADSGSAGLAQRGYSLGAVDYILKPLDPDVLRSKVAVFVELHRKTEQTRYQAHQLADLNLKLAHRSRLLEAKLEMVAGLGEVLQGSMPEDLLLDELLRRCLDAAGTARGAAYLIGPRGRVELRARVGYAPASDRVLRDFFGQAALLREIVREGLPVVIPSSRVPADRASNLISRADARSLLIAPMTLRGEPLGALVFASADEVTDDQETFARVVSAHASQAVVLGRTLAERAGLLAREQAAHAAAEAARRRFAFLAEASSELATALDGEAPLQRVAQRAVPEVADGCLIELTDEDGPTRCVAAAFADPAWMSLGDGLRGQTRDRLASPRTVRALNAGETLLIVDADDGHLAEFAGGGERQRIMAALGVRTAIIAPLVGRGRPLGAITLLRTTIGRPYGAEDVAFAEDLARRLAAAIESTRLYDEARAAVTMRDEFFAAASHDLKTPITAIKGQAQVLQRRAARSETVDAQRVVDSTSRIVSAATKMQNLVEELLDISRVQPGHGMELDRKPTDLVALARQVVDDMPRGAVGHEMLVESSEPELVGDWDPTRIERVLSNLIGNAVKYSPAGGRIRIMVGRASAEDEAVLEIEDTGIGIPSDEVARVFDRFYRARNVVGRIAGTGIGLAGVRMIVEQHGGRVGVQSIEGTGTTFTIRLPLSGGSDSTNGPVGETPAASR